MTTGTVITKKGVALIAKLLATEQQLTRGQLSGPGVARLDMIRPACWTLASIVWTAI